MTSSSVAARSWSPFPVIPILPLHLHVHSTHTDTVLSASVALPADFPTPCSSNTEVKEWMKVCGLTGEITLAILHCDDSLSSSSVLSCLCSLLLQCDSLCRVSVSLSLLGDDSDTRVDGVLSLLDAGFSQVIMFLADVQYTQFLSSLHSSCSHPALSDRLSIRLDAAMDPLQDSDATADADADCIVSMIHSLQAQLDEYCEWSKEFVIRCQSHSLMLLIPMLVSWHRVHPSHRIILQCEETVNPDVVKTMSESKLYMTLPCYVMCCGGGVPISSLSPSPSVTGEWLGAVLAGLAVSDRVDSLFPTVVVDVCGGTALGLVYSSRDSLLIACSEQKGVYWSRSRQQVWRKGETSGATQTLIKVGLDCDGDALRFTVKQRGVGFCHLNRWSCWFDGQRVGLNGLERTLEQRRLVPDPQSYTTRLLSTGSHLLSKKIIEEAGELVRASTPAHVASEAADVLYFTMVKMQQHGITLSDVERILDHRALRIRRRAGHAKQPNQQTKQADTRTKRPADEDESSPAGSWVFVPWQEERQ